LHSPSLVEEKRKLRLLVVDDERTIRKLLERIAARAGFEVDTARDGGEALEMLAVKDYDIAIVDLMMPRVSGYELVQHIASRKQRPTVIVATALTNGDVASLDDSVVRRVIKKPFDITVVATALIDTAKQVAEQRAAKETPIPIAPPEAAIIPVTEEPQREATDAPPAASAAEPEVEKPAEKTDLET
jgi:DNA-binding response OmpR family regulator